MLYRVIRILTLDTQNNKGRKSSLFHNFNDLKSRLSVYLIKHLTEESMVPLYFLLSLRP